MAVSVPASWMWPCGGGPTHGPTHLSTAACRSSTRDQVSTSPKISGRPTARSTGKTHPSKTWQPFSGPVTQRMTHDPFGGGRGPLQQNGFPFPYYSLGAIAAKGIHEHFDHHVTQQKGRAHAEPGGGQISLQGKDQASASGFGFKRACNERARPGATSSRPSRWRRPCFSDSNVCQSAETWRPLPLPRPATARGGTKDLSTAMLSQRRLASGYQRHGPCLMDYNLDRTTMAAN